MQQQEMQDTMTHNTQLTQESWGLTFALQYNVSNIFIHLGLDYQQSQPYQHQQYKPPEQNNDEEEENNNNDEEDKDDDDEDPDEGEQDSDEEDWASSKLGGSHTAW